jgi:putative chitinase
MELYQKYKTLFNSYHLNTPLRIAHFMAQADAESSLKSVRESCFYTSIDTLRKLFKTPFKNKTDEFVKRYLNDSRKCANYVYANRGGNGNEASGDGFKFRGGGFFQVTFKDGYLLLSKDTKVDFISNPDLICEEANGIISALNYWSKNSLNKHADNDDLDAISDIINIGRQTNSYGDSNGFEHRKKCLLKWKKKLKL